MERNKYYGASITILLTKGQKRRLEIMSMLKGKSLSETVRDIVADYLKKNEQ